MEQSEIPRTALPEDPRQRWSSLDQAARDAAYDNNAAVAVSQRWIEQRSGDSANYRKTHDTKLDLPYADVSERTAFDLYPSAEPTAPCLIFLHGGYWQRNSREAFACVAEGLGAAGWSVAIPGYSLAPQASLSEIIAEIGLAIDWLSAHGAEHGISGPLILAGWSAGAQLAAFHLNHPGVAAGLAVSGVYKLAPIRDTGLNKALQLSHTEIEALSPLRLEPARKPLTIAYGSNELPSLIHDSLALFAKRKAACAPASLLPVAGADHFSILGELSKPDGALTKAAIDLLSSL
ncbi:alpha/beta hydrolase [Bradyrhizobium sp. AZCC 2230]|uniref:alpha/beta hydrolase n=1 Tax=Bradyrhizobium sp. AZCC 2230 TaxID=3117021 RepID=UPI002FF41905